MRDNGVSIICLYPTAYYHDPLSVKNDSGLLFKKLSELKTVHRIIMTGVRALLVIE